MATTPHKNFTAGEDLSAHKDRFLTPDDGSGNTPTVVGAQSTELPIGIQTNKPDIGEPVGVAPIGIAALLKIGATVAFGDFLKPDSTGRGVPTAGAGELYGAVALQDGAVNDIINVEPVSPTRSHS